MNIFKKYNKSLIVVVLFIIAFISTIFSYLCTVYEYKGKGFNIPDIVSSDAIIGILLLVALSVVISFIVFCLKRKKIIVYIFMILMALNIYRIIQVIIVLNKVEKGILLKM